MYTRRRRGGKTTQLDEIYHTHTDRQTTKEGERKKEVRNKQTEEKSRGKNERDKKARKKTKRESEWFFRSLVSERKRKGEKTS